MKIIKALRERNIKIDDDWYEMLSLTKWHISARGYARSSSGEYMHRVIMSATKAQEIDHINGRKLDNRRENLRFCTKSENAFNSGPKKGSTSRYKGVSKVKLTNRWCAQLLCQGKKILNETHDTELGAAAAYNAALDGLGIKHAYMNPISVVSQFEII